jgi:hypothetical protein
LCIGATGFVTRCVDAEKNGRVLNHFAQTAGNSPMRTLLGEEGLQQIVLIVYVASADHPAKPRISVDFFYSLETWRSEEFHNHMKLIELLFLA